jgi:hypothetical protein
VVPRRRGGGHRLLDPDPGGAGPLRHLLRLGQACLGGIYAGAALVIPHQGRRLPGWINALGALRVAILIGALALVPVFSLDSQGIFGQGPGVWIPVGGGLVAGVVALLTEPHSEPGDGCEVILSVPR